MKFIRRVSNFFDNVSHDIRLFKLKPSIILGAITLCAGLLSWAVGGRADKVTVFFLFPRSAISIGFMYFLWLISFAFVGFIIGGIVFGCEKYKRRESSKICAFIVLSYVFTMCVYPIFFRFLSPFIAFLFLLVSAFFCFLSIMSSIRQNSLWSICLMVHFLWLIYNGYISFVISIIN